MTNFTRKMFWSSQKDVDRLVLQQSTNDIGLVSLFDIAIVPSKGKGSIPLKTGSTRLNFYLTS